MINIFKIIIFLALFSLSAHANNCTIPGWPGCTIEDFYKAMQEQRQQQLLEESVRQQKRMNQLLEERNRMAEQQMLMPQPIYPNYQMLQQQRCLTMPLLTPGC